MSEARIVFSMDGVEISAKEGQTILQAADQAGIYVPRLCYHPDLAPGGHCRICTVKVNGRHVSSCTMTAEKGMVVENNTPELTGQRRRIVEMMFVEGNHFCPFCEASGSCELQATAYRLGMTAPTDPYFHPRQPVDGTHPDVFIDRNRCILCGRCVEASRDLDGKSVFGFAGRGIRTRLAVDSEVGLGGTRMAAIDRAARICPTGCLLVKRLGYRIPYGRRRFDREPIGFDIEQKGKPHG